MKIFIPPAVTGADCKAFTEIFPIIPFLQSVESYDVIRQHAGYWNDGLYSKLYMTPVKTTRVDNPALADFIVLPFKYHPDDLRIQEFCEIGKQCGVRVICFYNDDNAQVFDLPSNLILFRTSANRSQMTMNERIFPVLVPDHKPASLILTPVVENTTIGFCGQTQGCRSSIINKLYSIWSDHDIKVRAGFWAPEITKLQARREYYTQMMKCSFTLCMRGGGNFSYRFYEALSFGRIPILIDTDMELPFEAATPRYQIKWDDFIIRLPYDKFMNMHEDEFSEYINHAYSHKSPIANRELWERFFAPESYIDIMQHDI